MIPHFLVQEQVVVVISYYKEHRIDNEPPRITFFAKEISTLPLKYSFI
jgi:hypothetical protein